MEEQTRTTHCPKCNRDLTPEHFYKWDETVKRKYCIPCYREKWGEQRKQKKDSLVLDYVDRMPFDWAYENF